MANRTSSPGRIHLQIVEVMKRFPQGITAGQIRQQLGLRPEDQTHLDRRKRDLRKWFVIHKTSSIQEIDGKKRTVIVYKYGGARKKPTDEGQVNPKLRAAVLHSARQRCQNCGRTVEKHGIALVVDHKKPRHWGGTNELENLWAICEECNAGKKAYFSSIDVGAELIKRATAHPSVHVRIGELLKAVGVGKRTPPWLIDIVADQADWQKRLRELRYSVIGWKIDTKLYKGPSGKKNADYVLRNWKAWPGDPTSVIRGFEQERERRNRENKETV